jgi:hypothetical protein
MRGRDLRGSIFDTTICARSADGSKAMGVRVHAMDVPDWAVADRPRRTRAGAPTGITIADMANRFWVNRARDPLFAERARGAINWIAPTILLPESKDCALRGMRHLSPFP